MGVKLLSYFPRVRAEGGLQAQIKLAMITKMSSTAAEKAPDSAENIKLFEEALKLICPKK